MLRIRKYEVADRNIVRHLCCETGFLGNAIDPVFEDRVVFANFLTGYYTDWEPESAFVLEIGGEVKGYLLGSRRPLRQQLYNIYQNAGLFLRVMCRYWRYSKASRHFVHWIVCNGWREVPAAPRRAAHFHINLLPEARNVASTRALMDAYLGYLHEHGEKRVYGQVVTFESRRGSKMFERYGFRVLNRSEISKYRRLHPEPVFLCTVIKNLEENSRLYARD
jgi:ribosomal protein S18 acetylase RimI-like enzyme